MGGEGAIDGGVRRRGLTFRKNDFFPEESFKSWNNYARAIMETPWRLMDRVLSRSQDHTELVEMKARSSHEMKKTLNWWDLMWFGIGAVIGSGIFVLTGLEARSTVGPAVVLSYVVSGVSALFSVFCYTEFAVEIPVAGFIQIGNQFQKLEIDGTTQQHISCPSSPAACDGTQRTVDTTSLLSKAGGHKGRRWKLGINCINWGLNWGFWILDVQGYRRLNRDGDTIWDSRVSAGLDLVFCRLNCE